MRILTLVFLLLITSTYTNAYADYVVCHDVNGEITKMYPSVSVDQIGMIDSSGKWIRPDCFSISKEKFYAINANYKVDGNVVGTNDQKIVQKSQAELDAEALKRQQEIDALNAKYQAVIDELKGIGLTDETINYILNR